MKKINNLELDLKKCLATLAATVTIFTMGGCAKEVVKEEVVETPTVTQPKEETPEEVVVDPNAPLFDIQDEEVFNQKVDELYAEIEGKKFEYEDVVYAEINSKEQAKLILELINFEFLSDYQIKSLLDNNTDNIQLYNDYYNALLAINRNDLENREVFPYSNYIASPFAKEKLCAFESKISNDQIDYEQALKEIREFSIDDKSNTFVEIIKANLAFVHANATKIDCIEDQHNFIEKSTEVVSTNLDSLRQKNIKTLNY